MQVDPNQGPQLFQTELLPARAAYLIRAGSKPGFRRSIQEASTRWGGMTEPIIPVRKGGRVDGWPSQVAEIAKVDAAVNVDLNTAEATIAARALGLPLVELRDIDRRGEAAWTANPASLPAAFADIPVVASNARPLWHSVAAGALEPAAAQALIKAGALFRNEPSEDGVARAALMGITLIDQSVSQFSENSGAMGLGVLPAILWITRPDSIGDNLFFWNLRALRSLRFSPSPMVLLPDEGVEHWLQFDSQLQSKLARPDEFSPDVVINSWTVDKSKLESIGRQLGLKPTKEKLRTSISTSAPIRTPPYTFATQVELRDGFVADRRYGLPREVEAFVNDDAARLRFDSQIAFVGAGRTKLRIRSTVFEGIPKRNYLARLIHRDATWEEGAIRLNTPTIQRYQFDLKVPQLGEVVETLLQNVTAAHGLSDKGRVGVAIRERGAGVLLEMPGCLRSIQELTTPRSQQLTRELEALEGAGADRASILAIAERWGGRGERRYRSAKELRSHATTGVLEALAAAGWVERGFSIHCSNCGLRSFVQIRAIPDAASCPGCRSSQQFASSASGVEVYYRLDAFIDRASDQGVLPQVLAAHFVAKSGATSFLLPGLEVTLADGRSAEVDLFGLRGGDVISGEVKTSPGQFTQDQIRQDVQNSRDLEANVHVMASPNDFEPSQVDFASRECAAAGLALLVLGKAEMDSMRSGQ